MTMILTIFSNDCFPCRDFDNDNDNFNLMLVSQVGNGHNWCSPYKQWQAQYMNDPFAILESQVMMMMIIIFM